ncbi:MAG: SDR family oxidoreductase [Acidaminococcus sp.]|jgi:NAD(P)-dependent dehydrogenase (short-subunit alcohol dehydrogenase family)|nr:SDR family oxidoreductase [Acidaminococcus sp.]MCI2116770.1 SDR family oxidoreductase [Acidaminococcus sp.]
MNAYGMEGRVGIITGGTSGIGLACAALLTADGAHVFLAGRSAKKGEAALQKLQNRRGQAEYIQADVSTVEGCHRLAEAVANRVGKIDFLVNSAGLYREQSIDNLTEKDYDEEMSANVKSTIFLTKYCLPLFSDRQPAIVNIASDAALEGNYGCAVYAAAKGAVAAFTRAAALDLAPRIRVNCICPGDVDTPLVEAQLKAGGYTREEMASVYPLGRIGKPEEIAHIICSVLSPQNGFMTGSILSADGGLTAK